MAVAISRIKLTPSSLALDVGVSGSITASVEPANATVPITWTVTSSNTNVCTVSGKSSTRILAITVKAVGAGTSTITVTATNSVGKKTVTGTVTVTDSRVTVTFHSDIGTPPEPIKINKDTPIYNFPDMSVQGKVFCGWYSASSGGNMITYGGSISGDMDVYAQWENHVPESLPLSYNLIVDALSTGNYSYRIITGDDVTVASGNIVNGPASRTFDVVGSFSPAIVPFNPALPFLPMLSDYSYSGVRAQQYDSYTEEPIGSVNVDIEFPSLEEISVNYTFDKLKSNFAVFCGEEIGYTVSDITTAQSDFEHLLSEGTIPAGWTNPFTVNGITWRMDTENIAIVERRVTIPFIRVIPYVETTVTYKGEVISTAEEEAPVVVRNGGETIAYLRAGDSITLKTAGTKCIGDITVGSVRLKCGGKIMQTDIGMECIDTGIQPVVGIGKVGSMTIL